MLIACEFRPLEASTFLRSSSIPINPVNHELKMEGAEMLVTMLSFLTHKYSISIFFKEIKIQ